MRTEPPKPRWGLTGYLEPTPRVAAAATLRAEFRNAYGVNLVRTGHVGAAGLSCSADTTALLASDCRQKSGPWDGTPEPGGQNFS